MSLRYVASIPPSAGRSYCAGALAAMRTTHDPAGVDPNVIPVFLVLADAGRMTPDAQPMNGSPR